jgi:acyl-CoA synthetase (AMP-forming)/AMP-acid ligase II
MYSSGTTGFPKGVELTHRNVVAHSSAVNNGFDFGPDALNLVAMPLFHVGGTGYAIAGIAHGAASILLREVDPALMLAAIAQGATHVFLVPAVIGGILAAGEPAVPAFSRVRVLGYGAAPMPLPMLTAALKAWPDTRFLQVYGMTEMAGVAVVLAPEVHRDPAQAERLTAAGRPLRGVEMRVVDPVSCQDLPPRTPGEVWFRTEQIMKGYLGRPDDSAAVRAPGGWLRTGDVGYLDEDGFLFVVDRLKDMIITGGENVYSPEVESVLMAHPDIADAAVIGVPHETWGETVRAVVVPRPGAAPDPDAVIAFTRERLAHYKCPTSVDVVPALPRNPSGKVLKRELRRPFWEGRGRQIV